MKGYFSLNKLNDKYGDTHIVFGNLVGDEIEHFAIATESAGNIWDYPNKPVDRSPILIAHDVIEHTVKHRTNKTVTFEEEVRALGAVKFVRDIYQEDEVADLLKYVDYRDVKYPPFTPDVPVEFELTNRCLDEDDPTYNIPAAIANLKYGYFMKAAQFNNEQRAAYSAFHFIEYNMKDQCAELFDDYCVSGYSYYFDTVMQVFRRTNRIKPHLREQYV